MGSKRPTPAGLKPFWKDTVEGMDGEGGLFKELRMASERAEIGGSPIRARLQGAYGRRTGPSYG